MSETSHSPSTEGEPAPGELELVRAFVNTRGLDPDYEEITGPEALRDWLEGRGLPVARPLGEADVARAVGFREALRALLLAKTRGEPVADEVLGEMRAASRRASLQVELEPDGSMQTAPATDGVDALVGALLAAAASAQQTGEWERLKICPSDACLWAFFDRSRNRSRTWCSMEVCGNRAKTRAYRAKRG